jgi:hypothetical protein
MALYSYGSSRLFLAALGEQVTHPVRETRHAGALKIVEQVVRGLRWTPLLGRETHDRVHNLFRQLVRQFAEVHVGIGHTDAPVGEGLAWEVAHVPGQDRARLPSDGCRHVLVVVRVGSRHLIDEVLVLLALDLAIGEELPDGRSDARRRFGRALLFADDDVLPLSEKRVCPQDVVDAILTKRQEDVHDREGEEDVGVRKDASHAASVREASFLHSSSDTLAAGTAPLTPRLERQDIRQQDAPMTAPGKAL